MAVGASDSQITWLGLAREKVHDDYGSGSSITGAISMYDLVHGGNTNGSGVSYDAFNACASPKPDTSTAHAASEWWLYDHDAASGRAIGLSVRSPHNKFGTVCGLADDINVYHDGSSTYAGSGDKIFTDTCASSAYAGASGWYKHTDPVGGGIYITVSGGNATVTSTYPC